MTKQKDQRCGNIIKLSMRSYDSIKHTINIVKELILFNLKNNISFYSFILIVQDKRRLFLNYFTVSHELT